MENLAYNPEQEAELAIQQILDKKIDNLFLPHELDGLKVSEESRGKKCEEFLTDENVAELKVAYKDRKSSLIKSNEQQFFKDILSVCIRINNK